MSRPTPETDAQFPSVKHRHDDTGVWVSLGTLRNLERQRDEARELARELRDALVANYEEYSDWSIRGDVHNRVVAALNKAQFTLPEK